MGSSSQGPEIRSKKQDCLRTTGHAVPTQRLSYGAWSLCECTKIAPEGFSRAMGSILYFLKFTVAAGWSQDWKGAKGL